MTHLADFEEPESYGVLLCDFGLGRRTDKGGTNIGIRKCGPLFATAPEVCKGEQYGFEADVYAFGILLWDLVRYSMRVSKKTQLPKEVEKLVSNCLSRTKSERPSMGRVTGHLENLWERFLNSEEVEMVDEIEAKNTIVNVIGEESEVIKAASRNNHFLSFSWS
jgi:serine/threonine protein kinase